MAAKKKAITLSDDLVTLKVADRIIDATSFTFNIDENEDIANVIGGKVVMTNGDSTKSWSIDNLLTEENLTSAFQLMEANPDNNPDGFSISLSIQTPQGLRNISLIGCRNPQRGMTLNADSSSNQTIGGTFDEIVLS